ncbi:D-Ala-D-Ala carboxypeptidase family metallohydrolase [Spirulina major CS-329]|uniref:D-Ala-D-Ala carboxypeptidase family metallohydrolase n=1 Tax=Spirulina TaxID=1154 RepID=UPI00232F07EC|nr:MULTISPECIES: D-Ala-D-Ala carboxypeptidase family metallohydrolase [Spirulina]MDB9494213.1 D-Ala-D-Ala carboxypeptidase family metallohydrolase [Spirulina subsalsa CS-330]MDB9503057.1 D-Ala-D-Ala carboxypeptidase family metallohydrolase [Spirulina major CS-329]
MAILTLDQRNYYYVLEAERTGIHKSILAALDQVQRSPTLEGDETGLGVTHTDPPLDTFALQVQYAANTIRTLTDRLIDQGWKSSDLWEAAQGRYSDRFLAVIAGGYTPAVEDTAVGTLATCDPTALQNAYLDDIEQDWTPESQAELDPQLLALIDRIPEYYLGLSHQRRGLIEVVRIWRKLDSQGAAVESLARETKQSIQQFAEDDLDIALKQFIQRISPYYAGFPHQREALLRLTQYWRQLPSRSAAIASLAESTRPDSDLYLFDPALLDFTQRIPRYYEGTGAQRNALTEGFRVWRQLNSRQTALAALGIDPERLNAAGSDQGALSAIATELDRELLNFVRRIPLAYRETHQQREALIRLVQLWRGLKTREQTLSALTDDLKRLEQNPPAIETPALIIPQRPDRWTPQTIELTLSIVPNGNFTWTEATQGGTRMPTSQTTVDAIVRIAELAQRARDRVNRPFLITSWYRPPHINRAVGGVSNSRHIVGDAIDFVCEGLSGNQLYWLLDPWWPGGLGRYTRFPHLCHIDARSYRARWRH